MSVNSRCGSVTLAGKTVGTGVSTVRSAASLLAAARSHSRENNTQLFSNTLVPLRYVQGYGERGNGDRTKNSTKMEKTAGFQP